MRAISPVKVNGRSGSPLLSPAILLVTSTALVFLARPPKSRQWVPGPVIAATDIHDTAINDFAHGEFALVLAPQRGTRWRRLGVHSSVGGDRTLRLAVSYAAASKEQGSVALRVVDAIRTMIIAPDRPMGGLAATEPWLAEAINSYQVPIPITRVDYDPVPRRYLNQLWGEPWPRGLWARMQAAWTDEGQALTDELAERYGGFWDRFAVRALSTRLPELHARLIDILGPAAARKFPYHVRRHGDTFVGVTLLHQAVFRLASTRGGIVESRGRGQCPICGSALETPTSLTRSPSGCLACATATDVRSVR
ncbi:hypothetical protein [Modestobacter caceresii]|uniref:hypothetical protein n=1 Tax=Modestobacter caceresii TaxID=1522368 RepID=UPI0012E05AE4|nr:hypothetical protein [Modestobacter caceresii]